MGAFLETTERNGKKLSAKRKLYLKFADAKLYLDDGSGTEPFFSNTEEKSRDFVWRQFGKNVFGEPCHVKDCGRL